MSTEAPPTAEQIAVRAMELKVLHLALMLSLGSILDPSLPILATELRRSGMPLTGDFSVCLYDHDDDGPDREGLQYSARDILTKATRLRGDVVSRDLLSISMMNAGTRIYDMIMKGTHNRTDVPLLQFARHFRNACGHGDQWNYDAAGPPHPAACRWLVLTGAHVGRRATWETVTPRLFVEFLDDIANHFAPGLVATPVRAVQR